ncbi:MAG: glucanase [Thalassobius sp.]|nr:glucanase [Thalassovita sp.]
MDYSILKELIGIDSPSGFTQKASAYIFDVLSSFGYTPEYTNKGAVKLKLGENPTLAIAAHVDTLGAIVSGIKGDGTLRFSTIGGLQLNSAEGEYVRVYTLDDKIVNGTILHDNPAAHVNKSLSESSRSISNLHIRLDENVNSVEDVQELGIDVGDFVCLYTHYEELESGYIKSRFLDNKAGCFVLIELARQLKEKNIQVPVELFFSNYEEVGHGAASGFAETIEELLVIDMGVVGDGCSGDETLCSICAKDSSGPYDFEMRKKLTKLAKENELHCTTDIFPYYGSDGSAALRAGNSFRVALIGPGVAASHGNERTHKQGIEATISLCQAYIESYIS